MGNRSFGAAPIHRATLGETMEVAEPDPPAQQPPPPPPPKTLPVDLLLEIVARCDGDAKTVVRCGLVCKALRRAMLAPGFHARLGRRRAGFDPGLLVAASYRLSGSGGYGNNEGTTAAARPIDVVHPSGRLPRFDAANLLGTSLEPTASARDGLLVLRKSEMMLAIPKCRLVFPDGGLQVCNTITGHVTSLPVPPPSSSTSTSAGGIVMRAWYQPTLLSVGDDDAGRSFELLLMCGDLSGRQLVTQIFSSKEGEWGAARKITRIQNMRAGSRFLYEESCTAPAVVGRTVHWLCYTDPVSAYVKREMIILAVRADDESASAAATLIKLPREFTAGYPGRFMLAATVTTEGERRLSLLVAETRAISLWALVLGRDEGSSSGSSSIWNRQEVIRVQEIDIDRPLSARHASQAIIWFNMFGERSGTVLFWMQTGGDADQHRQVILVQLNLVTKKTMVLWRGSDHIAHALLHETSLISVLKSF